MTERNDRHLLQDADNGDTTARLLRTAGLRDDVPADRAARVRREVLDECRAVARRRAVRRRAWGGAITLATAALLIVVVRLGTPRQDARAPVREIVATVARRLGDEGGRLTSAGGETLASTLLSPDDTIRAGDLVETDTTSRLGLRLASDVSLRLDAGTRARLISSTMVELLRVPCTWTPGGTRPASKSERPLASRATSGRSSSFG